ncbi:hypothetical protein Tsubulata_042907 [Turnera subulata]|uniref:WRKY domain-containing protein n=1 Tax=Turnera subulata TaxID=218843 RepID=A0A9Q0FF11_9ROSI|nr:hypothetical protein Tsubulata_042907 [Turnera subulata]
MFVTPADNSEYDEEEEYSNFSDYSDLLMFDEWIQEDDSSIPMVGFANTSNPLNHSVHLHFIYALIYIWFKWYTFNSSSSHGFKYMTRTLIFLGQKERQEQKELPTSKEKFAFKTESAVEILDDGYKWRKYGKKMVKNTPYPRCSVEGCPVKKKVERDREDPRYVITSYEGIHTHHISS